MEYSSNNEIVNVLKKEVTHLLGGSELHLATFRQRVASARLSCVGSHDPIVRSFFSTKTLKAQFHYHCVGKLYARTRIYHTKDW